MRIIDFQLMMKAREIRIASGKTTADVFRWVAQFQEDHKRPLSDSEIITANKVWKQPEFLIEYFNETITKIHKSKAKGLPSGLLSKT